MYVCTYDSCLASIDQGPSHIEVPRGGPNSYLHVCVRCLSSTYMYESMRETCSTFLSRLVVGSLVHQEIDWPVTRLNFPETWIRMLGTG
jgi:hypothetical protein